MKLVLASTSPRRREILALLGIAFEVIEPEFEEHVSPHRSIEQEVLDFAIGKARSVAPRHSESIIIGSDTMILLEGVKIGKPKDLQDAAGILSSLSGRTHRICTGVAIIDTSGGPGLTAIEEVSVDMRAYTMAGDRSLPCAGRITRQSRRLLDSRQRAQVDCGFTRRLSRGRRSAAPADRGLFAAARTFFSRRCRSTLP